MFMVFYSHKLNKESHAESTAATVGKSCNIQEQIQGVSETGQGNKIDISLICKAFKDSDQNTLIGQSTTLIEQS